MKGGFFGAWREAFLHDGLAHQWQQCEETGRLENFRRVAAGHKDGHQGLLFNDSDVYKVLEAAAYGLTESEVARKIAGESTKLLAAAQDDDGYLDTYFQLGKEQGRWANLWSHHEMYCAGHLFEAAAALHEAGYGDVLPLARKFADHVGEVFSPEGRLGYCGHEEIELGLAALARTTGEAKYAQLGRWMTARRGQRPSPLEAQVRDANTFELNYWGNRFLPADQPYDGAYCQDHAPLEGQDQAVGHAVRCMYFYSGACDLFEPGERPEYDRALDTILANLTSKRMYITGGIGSTAANEGFTEDYDLPNLRAYAETCAGIGLVFWAWRMAQRGDTAARIELMERSLMNGALSGTSLDAKAYFYENPLESVGAHHRQPWFMCACCPPNIARLVLGIGRYAFGESDHSLWVHLPLGATVRGGGLEVAIESQYPWEASWQVRVLSAEGGPRSLRLRQPSWCEAGELRVNGKLVEALPTEGYRVVTREWAEGDELTFAARTAAQWSASDSRVYANLGRVALQRGPLVYCLEERDLGAPVGTFAADVEGAVRIEEGLDPRGSRSLQVPGVVRGVQGSSLYAPAPKAEPKVARFTPYFAWNNGEPGSMQVWVHAR